METRDVPEEVKDLFDTGLAHADCRDSCLKSVFSARRAVGHAKRSRECYRKAWAITKELWPEVSDGVWEYDIDTRLIRKAARHSGDGKGGAE